MRTVETAIPSCRAICRSDIPWKTQRTICPCRGATLSELSSCAHSSSVTIPSLECAMNDPHMKRGSRQLLPRKRAYPSPGRRIHRRTPRRESASGRFALMKRGSFLPGQPLGQTKFKFFIKTHVNLSTAMRQWGLQRVRCVVPHKADTPSPGRSEPEPAAGYVARIRFRSRAIVLSRTVAFSWHSHTVYTRQPSRRRRRRVRRSRAWLPAILVVQ